jgi:diguanylate cyclase (GGDEF)-like protein
MVALTSYAPEGMGAESPCAGSGSLRLRPDDMADLLDSFRVLSDILEIEELYAALERILSRRFELEQVGVFVCDETEHFYELAYGRGYSDRAWRIPKTKPAAAPAERGDGEALGRTLNAAVHTPARVTDTAGDQFEARLWLPLVVRQEIIGFMALGARTDGQPFDDYDCFFLNQIAAHAAICIHTCRLYAQRQAEKEDLDKTLQNLSLLYSIGKAINYISDLKKLLQYILSQAIGITSAEKGSIMLYDMESDQLNIRVLADSADSDYQERVNNSEITCRSFRPGEGIAGRVFLTAKPLVVNNIQDDTLFVGSEATFVRSIACIPMVVYNETIGVINVTNKSGSGGFTPEDVNMLKAVADQAAVAVNKAQLWDMAVTDSLTGLFVRRYFMVKLQEEVHRSERYNKVLSVIMADLDHFKSINDSFGHAAGDRVLQAVGKFLRRNVREVDVLARYGGEEFVFLLPDADHDAAMCMAERLRRGLSQLQVGDLPKIAMSLGIASFPADGLKAEELIQLADTALYAAKQAGRNMTVCYPPQP